MKLHLILTSGGSMGWTTDGEQALGDHLATNHCGNIGDYKNCLITITFWVSPRDHTSVETEVKNY